MMKISITIGYMGSYRLIAKGNVFEYLIFKLTHLNYKFFPDRYYITFTK